MTPNDVHQVMTRLILLLLSERNSHAILEVYSALHVCCITLKNVMCTFLKKFEGQVENRENI